ncbi:MAG: MFS transporter [Rhodospirillaceae bacterium]|nr:MFS transporter [Rhodospirillaceae bacterium]
MEKSATSDAASPTSRASAAPDDYPSEPYAWYVVAVLVLAYTVSYIDRTILTLMVAPIRATLGISDVQISLLHGLAFAIFYTLLGVPIGWLADRANRTRIIAAGIFVWSLMTALCGLSRNFVQMFLARVGVGVGEAALSPAAYSMLADYFRPEKVTRAVSVYSTGVYLGSGFALIVGGAVIAITPSLDLPVVGHLEPWQVVFLAVGLPGLLVVALMATVREPKRRGLITRAGSAATVSFADTVAFVRLRRRAYGCHFLGYATLAMLWSGTSAWIPSFLIRTHGWTPGDVGLWFGLAVLILGTLGISLGGVFSDWLKRRGRSDANMLIGIVSALAVLPAGIIAPLMPNAPAALGVYCILVFFSSFPYGGAAAGLQEITPNQMRAQVSAMYLFVVNLAGIGVGPTLVASITQYGFGDDLALRYALPIAAAVTAPIAALLLAAGRRAYRDGVAEAQAWAGRGAGRES